MPHDSAKDSVTVSLTEADLLILNNALNEVCNGIAIKDFEFHARIGAHRDEALALLDRVAGLYHGLSQ